MAVYLTKSMLTNMNRVRYTSNFSNDEEGSSSSGGDHWQRFYSEGYVIFKLISNKDESTLLYVPTLETYMPKISRYLYRLGIINIIFVVNIVCCDINSALITPSNYTIMLLR